MQASAIKRRAVFQNPQLRMSANNVRDVMRYLLCKGLVRKVTLGRRRHPRYTVTDLGKTFQELLARARVH
jgi:predicted transcriptional regulator